MLSYAITFLVWGDNPNNTFSVLFSKKSSINDIKLKILKILNLKNDMIDKIKLYKVNEELYTNDKRFEVMKTSGNYEVLSPNKLFEIIEINNISQIMDCSDDENSFNSENMIGAMVVIENNIKITDDITNQRLIGYKMEEKNKIKENSPDSYNELDNNDEDEDYNGDYEDDASEYENNTSFRKSSSRNRKEKLRKQSQKVDKSKSCKINKEICDCVKDNYCFFEKNQKNSLTSSSKVPTPKGIVPQKSKNYNNSPSSKYTQDNINTGLSEKSEISSNKNLSITPQSLQSNSPHQNKSNPIDMNITDDTNNDINMDASISDHLNNNITKTRMINSSSSTIRIINNDELLKKETKIEKNSPNYVVNTKSIKVQGTANKNNKQNILMNNKNSHHLSQSYYLIDSNTNVGQYHDTPLEPVLYSDSLPIQETILNEEENQFNIQMMESNYHPSTSPNRLSNNSFPENSNQGIKNCTNSNINNNDVVLNNNTNNNINNNINTSPYNRIYYPDSDIEIMELNQALQPSAPFESQVDNESINYKSPNTIGDNNSDISNLGFNSIPISTKRSAEQEKRTSTTSPLNPSLPVRKSSISKTLVFSIDQFPTPPGTREESDITNIPHSQSPHSDEKRHNDVVIHQYYKSDLNDLPPSYENIDQQPSAPSLSELNSNNTLASLLNNNNSSNSNSNQSSGIIKIETQNSSYEGSYSGSSSQPSQPRKKHSHCIPCTTFDEYVADKFNISTKLVRFLKFIFISLLLMVSVLIVFLIIHLSQSQESDDELDCSIYTKTRLTTTVSGTVTETKTLVHRLVTIQEKYSSAEPTPRSVTSNTNEVDDFIIVSEGKGEDEGTIEWTIKELTDPYLVTSYYKKDDNDNNSNRLASASFQLRLERIVEFNDTISFNESESYYNLEASKENVNFAFLTNNDYKNNVDILKFSEYFTDTRSILNITLNYLFTSQSIEVTDPTSAKLNPQSARCFLEIENWEYKYENSNLLVVSSVTSSDLVWSVKEENVINLNNSEGKIILKDDVKTSRNGNTQNAKLSLYDDVIEFEEDDGIVDVEFLISNPKKSRYLLADIEILLRSHILDISTKEYVNSVNSVVSSSSSVHLALKQFNYMEKLFNLTLFNNRYFSIKKLYKYRQMKILSIFINLLIQLIIFHI